MGLRDMLFNYQKRAEMSKVSMVQEIISKYRFTIEETGNLKYLLRQLHENAIREKKQVATINEWVSYYFKSGEKRKNINTPQSKQYYGRTEEEILDMVYALHTRLLNDGYSPSVNSVANIVFIFVIDMPFREYMRCCNIMFRLKKTYQDMTFSLTTPLDMENYSVDIIAKRKEAVTGITVLPLEMADSMVNITYKQKHEIFTMIWGGEVIFVYAAVNGQTAGDLPKF